MNKKIIILSITLFTTLFLNGCQNNDNLKVKKTSETSIKANKSNSSTSKLSETTNSSISQTTLTNETLNSSQTTVNTTISTVDKTQPQEAQATDFSVTMALDGSEGPSMFYKLDVVNRKDYPIIIDTGLFNLKLVSRNTGERDVAPRYSQIVTLSANETIVFNQLLGGISGDTPGYNDMIVSYDGNSIYTQPAHMKEYSTILNQ
ncbi:hypothetical protein ACWOAH_11040 [Vagococcus vulneris]|uniref:Uncharacterized protein n=1 Tax=Vagococcus vulneris TaxID=1977869 RepID=A0A429ZSF6_9ENTE|nr:hypothetical protein [Vagococcus vulneris]RST96559.1 hypothetical protein CBF37_10945 [Vagococcus vulneris]